MIEAIRISRSAYPNRVVFSQFAARFRCLRPRHWHDEHSSLLSSDPSGAVNHVPSLRALLASVMDEWRASGQAVHENENVYFQFGRTKLYFSSSLMDHMEKMRTESLFRYAIVVQTFVRGQLAMKMYWRTRIMAIFVQACVRMMLTRIKYRHTRRCIIRIQSTFRRALARCEVSHRRRFRAASRIQALQRMKCVRLHYLKMRQAEIVIAAFVRMKLQVKKYIVMRDNARALRDLNKKLQYFQVFIQPFTIF